MRCISAFLLSLTLALSLTACSSAPKTDTSTRPEEPPAETPEPETPAQTEPEPYVISSPTVDRGTVDGVTYTAWDGIVEHLFFHPVVAYPELAFDGDSQSDGIDDWMVTAGHGPQHAVPPGGQKAFDSLL